MSGLSDEIIESQKVRSELLKWKLLIISALGAAGLGFEGNENIHGAYLDHVPLLWTQGNLWLALMAMQQSANRET